MSRLLSLYIPVKPDSDSQKLAFFVKDGFRLESWDALNRAGTVYEARITALEHPDGPAGMTTPLYSYIALTTHYVSNALPYQLFFWENLCAFFQLVAFAAKESPYTLADFTPGQLAALKAAQQAIADCAAATTDAEVETAQKRFKETNEVLVSEMDKDEDRKEKGEIAQTKFERFIAFVNQHDRTYGVGSPNEGKFPATDLQSPPNRTTSNYVNPRIQPLAR